MFSLKRRNSKSKKPGNGSFIAPAIIPTAAFVAVPRFAPPPFESRVLRPLGLSGLSAYSTFRSGNDEVELYEEVTELNSLHDYQMSAAELGTGQRRGDLNAPGLGPPVGFGDTDDESDLRDTLDASVLQETYDSLRSALNDNTAFDLAGGRDQPQPRRRARSADPDETTRKKTSGKRKGTKRQSRSSERQMEPGYDVAVVRNVESTESGIPMTYTVPLAATLMSGAIDVESTLSQLQLLEVQRAEADDKQRELEATVQRQSILHGIVQQKLKSASLRPDELSSHDLGSLLRESHSVTELTMRHQNEYCRSLEEKISVLEAQRQNLLDINEQQAVKLDSIMKQMQQQRNPLNVTDSELSKQVQELRDDADVLKSVIHRINQELSRYQTKFRVLSDSEMNDLPGLPRRGPKPSWLVNTKYLSPLIVAFDDQLKQKNDMILQYEIELEHFRKQFEDILKENKRLHIRIEQTDAVGEPVGLSQWRQLQEQCKLVLEENEILMRQLEIQEDKYNQRHKSDVQEVIKLTQRTNLAESENLQAQQEARELREKYMELRRQNDALINEMMNKLPVEEHVNKVATLKQHHQDEKQALSKELAELTSSLQTSELERESLVREVDKLNQMVKQFENEIKTRNKNERKYQQNVALLQSAMDEMQLKELTIEQYLNSVLKTAAKVAQERDGLVQSVEDHDKDKKKAWRKVIAENMKKSELREKMMSVRRKAERKVEEVLDRMKEQQTEVDKTKETFSEEIKHLRRLVIEKDDRIIILENEKKDLMDDLETMWQTASKSNRHMWETIRNTDNKLHQHIGLANRLPEQGQFEHDYMADMHISDIAGYPALCN